MAIMLFLIGALLGVLLGGALCVRYLRREIAADIGRHCGTCGSSSTTSRLQSIWR